MTHVNTRCLGTLTLAQRRIDGGEKRSGETRHGRFKPRAAGEAASIQGITSRQVLFALDEVLLIKLVILLWPIDRHTVYGIIKYILLEILFILF